MERKFDLDDELEMLLDDQLMKEAELLEKAIFADDSFEDYQETSEERQASFEKLVNRLKAEGIYRGDAVNENISTKHASRDHTSEDTDKIVTLRAAEKTSKNKKSRKFGRSMAKVASVVIVSGLCVFAASMTSEANRNYFINNMRILTGQDTRDVTDNDEFSEKVKMDEYAAVAEIEKKLQIEVPGFYYRPENFKYLSYEVDEIAGIARIQYLFNEEIVDLYMNKCQANSAAKMNSVVGTVIKKVKVLYEDIEVDVIEIKDNSDGLSSNHAKWERENVEYSIYGRIESNELCKIIEKLAY